VYSTCLFCHSELGANEVIEKFPVGRRLAFDSAEGRLWVVCRKCERWNLTPIEERWEAIEECERQFSDARVRVATDNIGMAKLREGLVLVRVGAAMRPEFAAWRYGDQFSRRRRKQIFWGVAGAAAFAGIVLVGPATGILAGGGWGSYQLLHGLVNSYQKRRPRLRLSLPNGGDVVTLRKDHVNHSELMRDEDGWLLRLSYEPKASPLWKTKFQTAEIRGPEAMRVAGQLLPKINATGAGSKEVRDAAELVGQYPDTEKLFLGQARSAPRRRDVVERSLQYARIAKFPSYVRLALEMASHESQERRAMEGELALLEAAWRQAEEVAKIADDLLLPEGVDEKFGELRNKRES
jgi:hypothetical protein